MDVLKDRRPLGHLVNVQKKGVERKGPKSEIGSRRVELWTSSLLPPDTVYHCVPRRAVAQHVNSHLPSDSDAD